MFAGGAILSGALDAEADRLGVGIPKPTGCAAPERGQCEACAQGRQRWAGRAKSAGVRPTG